MGERKLRDGGRKGMILSLGFRERGESQKGKKEGSMELNEGWKGRGRSWNGMMGRKMDRWKGGLAGVKDYREVLIPESRNT